MKTFQKEGNIRKKIKQMKERRRSIEKRGKEKPVKEEKRGERKIAK